MQDIPFLSLSAQHNLIRRELDAGFQKVVDGGRFILAEEVASFEKEYAAYSGVRHCISVANGLDALYISLSALGVGPGDEVIVPAFTCAPTWMAVSKTGARLVPVDADTATFNIDVGKISGAVTSKTKAIVPVNLYGTPADLPAIVELAASEEIFVVEDNAQAHGAMIGSQKTGSFGVINGTSFYPTKNLGALGDGGAITTDDPVLADKAAQLRNYGSSARFVHEIVGINSRLDELQAVMLRIKLRFIDRWNAERSVLAAGYLERLRGIGDLVIPSSEKNVQRAWHLFVVCTARRNLLQLYLQRKGIGTDIHYPIPPHLQKAYAHLGYRKGDFPVSEKIGDTVLSLPLWPGMSEAQLEYVTEAVRTFYKS
ncbi:MAG TPA: DegT/DnrJ/EryC1/StrS family aminotransferase [Cyclobacteriaceae bacterium]|nr:DegT/DnrJ/EryC1/StrS family aminotransferase [Cyclobacteriaceae bacterium]